MLQLKQTILVLCVFIFVSRAQTATPAFEGEIVYANTYKSKNPKLIEKQLSIMLGKVHNYFIKDGNYKTVTNGVFAQWQLYIHADNKIYNKMVSSDTVFWNDGNTYDDEVLSAVINKNVITIMGYMCDELLLNCLSGMHKYYYNAQLRVDSELFVNHKYGNCYNYLSRINAVPLKMVIEDSQVIMESVATKVIPKKLDAAFFTLPPNTKTAQSFY